MVNLWFRARRIPASPMARRKKLVPFLVEDELINLGATFSQGQELGRAHGV